MQSIWKVSCAEVLRHNVIWVKLVALHLLGLLTVDVVQPLCLTQLVNLADIAESIFQILHFSTQGFGDMAESAGREESTDTTFCTVLESQTNWHSRDSGFAQKNHLSANNASNHLQGKQSAVSETGSN